MTRAWIEAIRAAGGVERTCAQNRYFAALGFQLDPRSGRAGALGRSRHRRRSRNPAARSLRQSTMAGDVDEVDAGARARICAARRAARARAGRATACQACPRCAAMRRRSASPMPRSRKPPADTSAERVEREFFNLFIGLGRGELLPYGSYYLTGFLHERPLARLREDLGSARHRARRGQLRARRSRRHSVRDHVRARQRPFPGAAPGSRPQIFEKHLAPWIGRFFADLERAEAAQFLPRGRHARPGVHGYRNGSFRAAG